MLCANQGTVRYSFNILRQGLYAVCVVERVRAWRQEEEAFSLATSVYRTKLSLLTS